jgi:cyclophilin family peptidyl-prolyl cis-trans isomerase
MRLLPVAACAALAALAGCGSGTKTSEIPSSNAPATSTQAPTQASTQPAAAGCKTVTAPAPRSRRAPRPTIKLDPAKAYTVTVTTSCGTFAFRLDVKRAPHTAASIVSLANRHFFDDTVFHRIVPGFVIQGGDPTGTGTGGPGYKTVDKPPASTKYAKGDVAMAKAGAEPSGTSGSQFFVVTGDASNLGPDYAVVGRVVKGMDVVERIGQLGDQSQQPVMPVVISTLRVSGG